MRDCGATTMRSLVAYLRLALVLVIFAHPSVQQNAYTAPCRRWLHQTCIIDNKLFTDGGLVYEGDSFTNQTAEKNTYLLWEDLSTVPPETDTNGGFPVQNPLSKNSNVPLVTGGVLWPDNVNKLFYLYGGAYYDGSAPSFQLWLYDAIYDTWNSTDAGQDQSQVVPTTRGAGAVDARGVAYYYGGYASNQTSSGWSGPEQMTSDLITYTMATNSWSSSPPTTGAVPRAEGVLLYIPASDAGMLVYFGGVQEASNGTQEFLPMDQIQLYDAKSGTWYSQTASGSPVPPPRKGFCAGVTWADDYSSYNIYLYGGFDEDGNGLNDAWILTLPSFVWISLQPSVDVYTAPKGHGWTSCNVYARSQMIVMGGYFPNLTYNMCDVPELGNQHVMSLGQQNVADATWYVFLPNVTTYEVPSNIVAVVGGGSTGGATLATPSAGWGNVDLPVYFTRSYTATKTPTRYIPSSTSTSTATSTSTSAPSSGGGTNVGAIAGGVVGGVVGLIAILGLAICCLRRRKRSRAQVNAADHQKYAKNSSYVSELPASRSPVVQHYSPHDSPQHPQGSPPMHHQQQFSQSSNAWYQESPVQQTSGTNWSPVPVYGAGPTQPAGPAPNQSAQTYYPPPPRPQHSSAGEGQDVRVELSAMRTPVPLDRLMLRSKDDSYR